MKKKTVTMEKARKRQKRRRQDKARLKREMGKR